MNKQELFEKIEGLNKLYGETKNYVVVDDVLNLVKLLDEPQKPVVKQFVADWYEEHRENFETELFWCISLLPDDCSSADLSDFENWLVDENTKPFQTLVNMHQFGYEIEKEKRYRVKVKGVCFNSCLIFEKINKTWLFSSIYEIDHQRGNHTRKELEEAGFGWVFDCEGIEIEEVEG